MEHGTRTKETTTGSVQQTNKKIGGDFVIQQNPGFIKERIAIYDELIKQQKEAIANHPKRPIKITLKDGKVIDGTSFQTTAFEIARKINKKLAESAVVAKITYTSKDKSPLEVGTLVNSGPDQNDDPELQLDQKAELYDLQRPLEGDCNLEILDFEDPLGKQVFWHSSAHVLGEALELDYGCHLCIGPPLNNGFYYDCYMGKHHIQTEDFQKIEATAGKVLQSKQVFERIVLTKQQALDMFKSNPFKAQLIQHKIPEGGITTAYRCGDLIDLCTGPHVVDTGRIKAFQVTKNSSSYWLGKAENDDLQRVYGISFPSKQQMVEYNQLQEELKNRDHRNIGVQQELFRFSELSPGSAFFFPKGAYIYNKLAEIMRHQYKVQGYQEVITPNIFNADLWRTSGHLENYQKNMFMINIDDDKQGVLYGMKPMNCPGHCAMFDMQQRSYRELPLRYADFGVLHRNEVHGALSGLTRVRRFCQDDAHIFCTINQVQDEVMAVLDFLSYIYDLFGFEFKLELSTKPEKALGDEALWQKAEAALTESLNKFGRPWKINPGDGAFYGPKIDVKLFDAMKREFQCGTLQLDFNLPIRFNLQYRSGEISQEDMKKEQQQKQTENSHQHDCNTHQEGHHENHIKQGFERPVIIHRAILGSIERFLAILCEHTAGKWPFFISPRQVIVIPISEKSLEYAEKVYNRLKMEGYQADIDRSDAGINKKVRNAQLAQHNYMAVVGKEEAEGGYVDLRSRDEKDRLGKYTIDQLLALFRSLKQKKSAAELKLEQEAFKQEDIDNLSQLNKELELKVFLDGEGLALGPRDKEQYEILKENQIDQKTYPNLYRWQKFLKSQLQQ